MDKRYFTELTLPEQVTLAARTGIITPPLEAISTEPGRVLIADETFSVDKLAALVDARLQNTPITDLMFD